jgi:hypothetical protein
MVVIRALQMRRQMEKTREEAVFMEQRANSLERELRFVARLPSATARLMFVFALCSNQTAQLKTEEAIKDQWRAEQEAMELRILQRRANLVKKMRGTEFAVLFV